MTAQFFTIFSSPESDCRCQVLFYHVSGLDVAVAVGRTSPYLE